VSLSESVIGFGRLLRGAGLTVGTADIGAALQALTLIDIGVKDQVEAALRCTLCGGAGDFAVFDAAFAALWQARGPAGAPGDDAETLPPAAGSRRLAEAAAQEPRRAPLRRQHDVQQASAVEQLRRMDFEAMSAEEIAEARRAVARLAMPRDWVSTRRRRPDPRGAGIDMAGTWRSTLRDGGLLADFARTSRRRVPPPLVVLCDISGSMQPYAPMLLRFTHALTRHRRRVHVFLFGTRLTNVTRALAARDPEVAMQAVGGAVADWSGGTRIGDALHAFNQAWGRRVLGQGARVLLLTDGLDRGDAASAAADLGAEMARLHRNCKTLIWLNPLLRWSGFTPRAASIAAMLPHVDIFAPAHNLVSLGQVADILSGDSRSDWRTKGRGTS
jgi:uncharacterized protein with von Willebrand factor type A (vWA) domain